MKIGTLSKHTGVSVDTIRYYEKRGLIPPAPRTDAGYRHYTAQDVQRLRFIVQAKGLGFTLEEIATLLAMRSDTDNCQQVRRVAQAKADDIEQRIQKLRRMHDILSTLAQQCAQTPDDDACPILKMLEQQT